MVNPSDMIRPQYPSLTSITVMYTIVVPNIHQT